MTTYMYSIQFRRGFSALHIQILKLISIGSYFPEVRAFGTLISSTKYLSLLTSPT